MDIDWTNEEQREAYIQKKIEEEVSGLKQKKEELMDKVQSYKKKLPEIDEIDVDEYKRLKEEKRKIEEERKRKEGEFDKILEERQKEWQEQIEAKDNYVKKVQSKLEKTFAEGALRDALSKNGGNTSLLLPIMRDRVRVVDSGDDFTVEVYDKYGKKMLNEKGEAASVDDLINEYKNSNDYAIAFQGSQASGSGTQGGSAKSINTNKKFSDMTLTERMKLAKENPDLYKKLRN